MGDGRGPLGAAAMERVMTALQREVGDDHESLALAKVAARGDPFLVLIACIVSLRTRDEVTGPAGERLIAAAPSPQALAALDEAAIAELIHPCSFYRAKSRSLRALAETLLAPPHNGVVPDDLDALCTLPGVGRKTANMVVTLGFREAGICVDTHVHRICNRLGYVRTPDADKTELVLREHLPRRWWIPANDLMVVWGRTICAPISPRCSECAVSTDCQKVGVTRSR